MIFGKRKVGVSRELWDSAIGEWESKSIINVEAVSDKLYRKCERIGDEMWVAWRLIKRLQERIDEKNRVIEAYSEMLDEERRRKH